MKSLQTGGQTDRQHGIRKALNLIDKKNGEVYVIAANGKPVNACSWTTTFTCIMHMNKESSNGFFKNLC